MTRPGIIHHPGWVARDRRLQCRRCRRFHDTEESYDVDFLGHELTADEAYRGLSARSYLAVAAARGWPPAGGLPPASRGEGVAAGRRGAGGDTPGGV